MCMGVHVCACVCMCVHVCECVCMCVHVCMCVSSFVNLSKNCRRRLLTVGLDRTRGEWEERAKGEGRDPSGSSQVKSSQVKSSQVKSSQVKGRGERPLWVLLVDTPAWLPARVLALFSAVLNHELLLEHAAPHLCMRVRMRVRMRTRVHACTSTCVCMYDSKCVPAYAINAAAHPPLKKVKS